ncbi:hypothetical protein CYY_007826 [Polysphondylium violaceum]|uniref:Armadillo-like helical domain-containing protein n=1 Tax=Polysphondylium violaceum TaxID=133409 RepID=A0A8J4PMX0_9MYCE|nr:hypothetical protein CYY_007826 [Polysphondylium violaceum]
MSSNDNNKGTHRRIGINGRSKSTVSLFQINFDGPSKTLKTPQQKPYQIPSKKPEDFLTKVRDRESTGQPVYLGNDGTFYDINYVPVFKHKLPDKNSNSNSATTSPRIESTDSNNDSSNNNIDNNDSQLVDDIEDLQERLFHLYNSIPQIDEFENFFDYEQAFLGWKFAVDTIFKDSVNFEIRLPLITGRSYYRPKVSDFQKLRENSTFDYRPSVSSFSIENDSDEKSDPLNSEVDDDPIRDSAEYDLNLIKDLENASEPWDSLLVPQEPQPADYDTFEDYDDALVRWAAICSTLSFFPPHASQLRDLIPIQSISESQLNQESPETTNKYNQNEKESPNNLGRLQLSCIIKSGIKEMNFLHANNTLPTCNLILEKERLEAEKKKEAEEQKLKQQQLQQNSRQTYSPKLQMQPSIKISDETKSNVQSFVNTMLQKRLTNMSNHKSYTSPHIATIHGTFPLPLLTTSQKPTMCFKNDHLRRLDLGLKQIQDHFDCPSRIGGVSVDFEVPNHDVSFEFDRLFSDPAYQGIVMNQLRSLRTEDRYNYLYSWYHPLVPPEEHQKHKEEIDFIIMSQHRITKDKIGIQNISDILYGDMYLDKFSDLLDSSFSEDFDGGKSYATVITKCVTPENIHELLSLLENSKSPLFQAKMSFLIMNFFSGNKGSSILEKLIQDKDVKNLSTLTNSFDFLSEAPVELFPWSEETNQLVKQVLGDSIETLWKLIFIYYYLNVIGRVLEIHVHLYFSKSVINQSKVSITHSIASLLQQNTPNILDKIFTGISHRSSTVSSFCLFILLQLMHNQEGLAVHNCLKAENSNLFGRIKRLCDSKLKHVQFSSRRLFSVLGKAPWVDFAYKEYNKDLEACAGVNDFIGSDEKRPSQLFLELLLEFFTTSLDRTWEAATASLPITNTVSTPTTPPLSPVGSPPISMVSPGTSQPMITIGIKNKFSFVLDGVFFHYLLAYFFKNSKVANYQMYVITSLLAKLSKTHWRLGNINVTHNVKTSQKKWGQQNLYLSPLDIRNMSSKINDPVSDGRYSYLIKTNMLCTLRHLFKCYPAYEIIKKEDDFYSRLLSYCKDGTSSDFNKEAWRLLYQLMRYHTGTLEILSKDILSNFLELVGTSSHITVITSGLHYITKMFNIFEIESKSMKRNKADLKIIEKEMKTLNALFISKSLFIKIHMIYKKFTTRSAKEDPVYGLAFIELAKFYNTMYSPHCSKLFKATIKKPEYKDGLTKIFNMFSHPASDGEQSSSEGQGGGNIGKSSSRMDNSTGCSSPSPSTASPVSSPTPSNTNPPSKGKGDVLRGLFGSFKSPLLSSSK